MYNDYSAGADGFFAFFAFLGVFLLFFSVIAIVIYILGSIGLMKLAEREGVDNSWLAFIPIANLYILGEATQDRVEINNLPMWLIGGSILSFFSGVIPIIGFIIPFAFYVFTVYVVYKLLEKYTDKSVLLAVLGAITGLLYVFLFFVRNNDRRI